MMDRCINIETLERTAYKKWQGQTTDLDLEEHLGNCSLCREIYRGFIQQFSFTRDVYRQIPAELIESIGTGRTANKISSYSLVAQVWETESPDKPFGYMQMKRAADSPELSTKIRYRNHGVLSTDDGAIIVRIIEDIQNREISLHLIADDEQKVKNVPITITPGPHEVTTDQFGRINLGSLKLPRVNDLKVTIHAHRAEFDLSVLEMEWKERIGQGEILVENQCNEHLYVEFQPEGETYKLVLRLDTAQIAEGKQKIQIIAEKENQPSRVGEVSKGVAIFHDVSPDQQIRVIIFG